MVYRRQLTEALLILPALLAALVLTPAPLRAEIAADSNAIHNGPCTKAAAGRRITLEIDPKPVRHMRELTFRVKIAPSNGQPETLLLDLSMPGMVMGQNQVTLKKTGSSVWEGKGIIVRCMSGRTLWQAAILSPGLENPSFIFNVRD